MSITTFRIAPAANPGKGLRIAATRRPPRGVPKARWVKDGYFDVWFPLVAPSAALLARARGADWEDAQRRAAFFKAYERELERTDARYALDLLAAVAARLPIAIGCYCEDESRCHRRVLVRMIEARMARLPASSRRRRA